MWGRKCESMACCISSLVRKPWWHMWRMSCSASSREDGAVLEFGLEGAIGLFFVLRGERYFSLV